MGASIRPTRPAPIVTDDDEEFQRWKAAQRAQPNPSSATDNDAEYQAWKAQQTPKSAGPRSTLYNAINTADNMLTAGLGQKFNAAFNAGIDALRGRDSFGHSYNANLEAEHQGLESFRKAHPIGSAVSGAIGGAGQVMAAAPFAAAGEMARGASMGARALAAGKTGFGLGATAALGNAPNTGGLLENAGRALIGGTIGGTVGAAAVPVAEGVGSLAAKASRAGAKAANNIASTTDELSSPFASTITPRAARLAGAEAQPASQITPATRLMLARLKRAGITPEDAIARLSAAPGDKPLSIMELAGDAGHPIRQLGKLVTRTPSTGAANLRAAAAGRTEALPAAQRILSDVSEAMGAPRTNMVEHGEQLAQQRIAAAKPFYDAADASGPVPLDLRSAGGGPGLGELLDRPSMKSAMRFHNDVALERGETPLTIDENTTAVPLRSLQLLKFNLDEALGFAEQHGRLPDGSAATKAKLGAINETRTHLLDILGQHSPDYAKGNEMWAGESALQDAGKAGRRFLSAPIDELRANVTRMTPGEQEQHNIAAVSGPIRDRLFKTNAIDRAKILSSPDIQERLQAVVPADRLATLRQNVGHEHQIALTHQALFGGSDTFENAANSYDAGGLKTADHAVTALTQGPKRAAQDLMKKVIESRIAARLQGVNEKTADALAPMLTGGMKNRGDLQAVLDQLALQDAIQRALRPTPPMVGAAAGVTFGRPSR